MKDESEPKEQLVKELKELRQRITELEKSETKCKKAQEALSESEEKYRTLIEQSIEGIAIMQDFQIVFANKAFAKISGYTVKELLSLSPEKLKAIVHPEDQALVWGRYKARLEGKSMPPHYEFRGVRKDGQVRWLEMYSSRINYNGKPAIQAAIIDITERKEAEKILQQSEEKYRTLIEQSLQGIVIVQDYQIVYSNSTFAKISGYSVKELSSLSPEEVKAMILPEDRSLAWKRFKSRLEGKSTLSRYEYRAIRKDGSVFWVEGFSGLIDFQGKPAIQATLIDITERKEVEEELKKYREHLVELVEERTANLKETNEKLRQEIAEHKKVEAALKETELRYQTLFENAPIGIGLATLDGQVLSCNETMCQITGYPRDEFYKIKLRNTYKDPKKRDLLLKHLKKKGFVRDFEAELKRKDGTPYYARLTIRPITLHGKKTLLTLCEDITKRKKAETALSKSEAKLRKQKEALEQKTIALREIIAQIEIEKNRIKEDIETNVDILINPILEDLRRGKAPLKVVNLLHHHLDKITSSYGTEIIKKKLRLSPREIEVCNMIKGGFTSKDISNILNISYQTVERHRKNIRHKLGISNKPINLTSYLREL